MVSTRARGAFALYGEEGASCLANFWCRKPQRYVDLQEAGQDGFVFAQGHRDGYAEPTGVVFYASIVGPKQLSRMA
eukprot:2081703-Lingulodinium_polyedra.AAC.1